MKGRPELYCPCLHCGEHITREDSHRSVMVERWDAKRGMYYHEGPFHHWCDKVAKFDSTGERLATTACAGT